MSTAAPGIGARVRYRLRRIDVEETEAWRRNFQLSQAAADHIHPHETGGSRDGGGTGAPGYVAHWGLQIAAGDVVFADVIEEPYPNGRLSLSVNMKGTDPRIVTGVPEGTEPGTWERMP